MKKVISLILALALLMSMSACGGKNETASVDLKALYESYSQYMPDMFFPDEDTMMNFLGIDTKDCVQYQIAICAEGMRADEVWLMEAKNASSLENLRQLAETRVEAKKDETVSYAPDQYVVVEKAVILTQGNYLALLISPDVDALKAGFESAFQ